MVEFAAFAVLGGLLVVAGGGFATAILRRAHAKTLDVMEVRIHERDARVAHLERQIEELEQQVAHLEREVVCRG